MSDQLPTYVEDGRPCQLVRVSELMPGDELLGWNGEPWTFGRVHSVRRVALQTYAGPVRHGWEIRTDSGDQLVREDQNQWRRIARRDT